MTPEKLQLRGYDASDTGISAISRIPSGPTLEEIRSGVPVPFSDDILEHWIPNDPDQVDLLLCLVIGWVIEPGTNNFMLRIVTDALRRRSRERKHAVLHCKTFKWPIIKTRILETLAKCERSTWDDSVEQLRKHFDWEYEGMSGTRRI